MSKDNFYIQKKQNELDMYNINLKNLKALSSNSTGELQTEMNMYIRVISNMIDECKIMLSDEDKPFFKLSSTSELGVESAWSTLKHSVNTATLKFTA
jgi:hypothetical protein